MIPLIIREREGKYNHNIFLKNRLCPLPAFAFPGEVSYNNELNSSEDNGDKEVGGICRRIR